MDAAKAFLSTLDEVPECQVTQLVSILNADIRNVAQDILDPFDLTRVPDPTLSRDDVNNSDGTVGLTWIPTPLARLLHSSNPDHYTSDQWESVVQTAVQAGVARYAKHLASTWDFAARGTGQFETLYEAVRKKGTSVAIVSRVYKRLT